MSPEEFQSLLETEPFQSRKPKRTKRIRCPKPRQEMFNLADQEISYPRESECPACGTSLPDPVFHSRNKCLVGDEECGDDYDFYWDFFGVDGIGI